MFKLDFQTHTRWIAATTALTFCAMAQAQEVTADYASANGVAVAGLIITTLYFLAVWMFVGDRRLRRDSKLRPMPPTDLAPAALRYVTRMRYDEKTLAAAIASMASKGYLFIEDAEHAYALVRDEGGSHLLSREELALAKYMFSGRERFILTWSNRRKLAALQRELRTVLEDEYGKQYFKPNTVWRIAGLVISTVVFLSTAGAVISVDPSAGVLGSLALLFLGAVVFVAGPALLYREVVRGRAGIPGFLPLTMAGVGIVCSIIGLITMADAFASIWDHGLVQSAMSLGMVVAVNLVFLRRIPRYTHKGWCIVREARSFTRHLDKAADGIDSRDEAERLFEVFLPYALALDREVAWARLFNQALDGGPRAMRDAAPYSPVWYSGRRWDHQTPAEFTAELSQGLCDAVSNSSGPAGRTPGRRHESATTGTSASND